MLRIKGADTQKVDLGMDQTFHDRRQKLTFENMSIDDLINVYPWLQGDGIIREYARISDTNISVEIGLFLSSYLEGLLHKVKS